MKNLYFLLIGLLLSISGFAQSCLPEGITFTTQEQIDSFTDNYPGCTMIEGSLHILGNNIENLNGLNVLTSIGGDLIIGTYPGNPSLTSLSGLDNLTFIGGSLEIRNNDILNSLSGLDNITSIADSLKIIGNPSLVVLCGLGSITSVEGSVIISYNDSLTCMTGLDSLNFIGGKLDISNNTCLTSLTGIESLTLIGGDYLIYCNPHLTSLTGLTSLISIGGDFQIGDGTCWGLGFTSLSGLEALNLIGGDLRIEWNHDLMSLAGLDNIETNSITNLYIYHNYNLSYCSIQNLCDYLVSPNGTVDIVGNSPGCNNPTEVASACGISLSCLPFGNYYFYSQADIDNFHTNYPECSQIEGSAKIEGNDISNLHGLSGVTSIKGYLQIISNPELTSLSGLDSLTSIGGNLFMYENNYLLSLAELQSLIYIGSALSIYNSYSLIDLTGLNSLKSIGAELRITGNFNLNSLTGLDSLSAESISNLYIDNNHSLSNCDVQSICDYLISPNGIVSIHDNYNGCDSPGEVEYACETMSAREIININSFSISPNPSSNQIAIETTNSSSKFQISIFNFQGLEVRSVQMIEPIKVIVISNLLAGVYFVRMTGETVVSIQKFIKID